jgi:hypothetical protein
MQIEAAAGSSETLVPVYQTAWRQIQERSLSSLRKWYSMYLYHSRTRFYSNEIPRRQTFSCMTGYEVFFECHLCGWGGEKQWYNSRRRNPTSVWKCSLAIRFRPISHAVQSGCITFRGRYLTERMVIWSQYILWRCKRTGWTYNLCRRVQRSNSSSSETNEKGETFLAIMKSRTGSILSSAWDRK